MILINCKVTVPGETEIGQKKNKNAKTKFSVQPVFYGVRALIPGKPTNLKFFGTFPFLILGCLMPLIDFVSDIGTAGRRFNIV